MGRHVAPRRQRRPATPRTTGRRIAERTAASLPSVPAHAGALLRRRAGVLPGVTGVIALAVAGGGAVSTGTAAAGEPFAPQQIVMSASGLQAVDGATESSSSTITLGAATADELMERRERAISRDSQRQALQDAADAELVQAADEQALERNARLRNLARATEERAAEIALNQWVLPTSNYRLTARFGMSGSYWSSNHTGLDFAAPSGTPTVSISAGTVTETGYAGAYGNRVIITHNDGTEVWYCHLSSVGVQPGQTVAAGQQIGTVGSTGNSTGPHLHLEVRPGGGDPVDPERALAVNGITP